MLQDPSLRVLEEEVRNDVAYLKMNYLQLLQRFIVLSGINISNT